MWTRTNQPWTIMFYSVTRHRIGRSPQSAAVIVRSACDEAIQPSFVAPGLLRRYAPRNDERAAFRPPLRYSLFASARLFPRGFPGHVDALGLLPRFEVFAGGLVD